MKARVLFYRYGTKNGFGFRYVRMLDLTPYSRLIEASLSTLVGHNSAIAINNLQIFRSLFIYSLFLFISACAENTAYSDYLLLLAFLKQKKDYKTALFY